MKRRMALVLLAAACGWSGISLLDRVRIEAQEPTPPAAREKAGKAAKAASGDVQLESSQVVIFVDKVGFGHRHAVMGKLASGRIRLGAEKEAGQLVFDMTSFIADTAEARRSIQLEGDIDDATQKKVTTSMLGKSVLDVAQFPTASYDIESAKLRDEKSTQGNPQYTLQGQFTLHGVTRPVAVNAEAVAEGDAIHLRGEFTLLQTEYGIKPFSAAFGAARAADKLTVHGKIALVK